MVGDVSCNIGFNEVEESDATKLLEANGEELLNEELMLLDEQQAKDLEEIDETPPLCTLIPKDLSEAFQLMDRLMAIFTDKDPDRERSSAVNRLLIKDIEYYKGNLLPKGESSSSADVRCLF